MSQNVKWDKRRNIESTFDRGGRCLDATTARRRKIRRGNGI
jgi:hypothetical protein